MQRQCTGHTEWGRNKTGGGAHCLGPGEYRLAPGPDDLANRFIGPSPTRLSLWPSTCAVVFQVEWSGWRCPSNPLTSPVSRAGGHVNPAVSLALATVGKFPWAKLVHYFTAQYLGAFLGSLLTYIVYREGIDKLPANQTRGIFGTYMREDITPGTAIVDQVGQS